MNKFNQNIQGLMADIRSRIRKNRGGFMFFAADPAFSFHAYLRLVIEAHKIIINDISFAEEKQVSQFISDIEKLGHEIGYEIVVNNCERFSNELYLKSICTSSNDPLWTSMNQKLANFYTAAASKFMKEVPTPIVVIDV